VIRGVISDISV